MAADGCRFPSIALAINEPGDIRPAENTTLILNWTNWFHTFERTFSIIPGSHEKLKPANLELSKSIPVIYDRKSVISDAV
jgi:hypothetical protein